MIRPFNSFYQALEDALVEASLKEKNKGDAKATEEKKYAPYWFEDGKFCKSVLF